MLIYHRPLAFPTKGSKNICLSVSSFIKSRVYVFSPLKSQFIFRNTKPKSFPSFVTYQASLTLINHLIRQRGWKRSLPHVSLLDLDPAIEENSHGKASVSSPRALAQEFEHFIDFNVAERRGE